MAVPDPRPDAADVYMDWQRTPEAAIQVSPGGTVVVATTCNWGPIGVPVELLRPAEFDLVFGSSDTQLRRAAYDAFKGHGWGGKGGANRVIAIRLATGAAAAGALTLNNTSSTAALTLTARYKGTRIDAFRVTVQDAVGGGKELLVLDGGRVVEQFSATTNIAALATSINATSKTFTAASIVTGTALTNVASADPSAGNDGTSLTGTEWTAATVALNRVSWDIFAAYGMTDPTIRATLEAWLQDRNAEGQRCWGYFGGAAGESLSTGNARSQALNDYNIVNLVGGTFVRQDQGGRTCGSSELVARMAGVRAYNGESSDDLFVRLADVEFAEGENGVTAAEEVVARSSGSTVFRRDTHEVPVYAQESVTTYWDDSASPLDENGNPVFPVEAFKQVQGVAIQHGIQRDIAREARGGDIIGRLGNTAQAREIWRGKIRDILARRERAQIVQAGWTVDDDGTPDPDSNFYAVAIGFKPVRALRQLFLTAQVG